MRLYIAGPMTGLPQFNLPAFDEAAARLRALGHYVISPTELDDPEAREASLASADGNIDTLISHGFEYEDFLDRDTEVLRTRTLDAIVLLPGWGASRGANRELGVAIGLGMSIWDYDPREPAGMRRRGQAPTAAAEWESLADVLRGDIVADASGAVKADGGKARMDLLPPLPLAAIAEVFTFGESKYSAWNWASGFAYSRLHGAVLRHLNAWAAGEDLDKETGLPHLASAGCDIMMLLEFVLLGTGTDDRHKTPGAQEVLERLSAMRRPARPAGQE